MASREFPEIETGSAVTGKVGTNLSIGAREGLTFRFREDGREVSIVTTMIYLSIGVHVLAALAIVFLPKWFPSYFANDITSGTSTAAPQTIQTTIMTLEDLRRLEGRSRNVVESSKGKEVTNPSDLAPYLGERTQRVERQTVAKGFGNATGGARGSSTGTAGSEQSSQTESAKPAARTLGFGSIVPPAPARSSRSARGRDGDGSTYGSHDAVDDDVAVSTETLLNTDEYRYASFFNRLKSEVAPRWEGLYSAVMADSRFRVGPGVYKTLARFTANRDGEILRVDIVRSSGAGPLDEAARSALLQVLRVQNLPAALQDGDGLYRIEFGFLLSLQNTGIQMQYVPDRRLIE